MVTAQCWCCHDKLHFEHVSGELYLCDGCQEELGPANPSQLVKEVGVEDVNEFEEDHQP